MTTLLDQTPAIAKGMALMFFATICFTTMQTGIRIVAADMSNPLDPLELVFFRNLFGVLALMPVLLRSGVVVLKTRRLRLHLTRAALQSVGMISFFTGLTLIPFAEVTALSFSAPLFATLFAVVLLGERVRGRRISALVIGFVGVLVVLQPGSGAVSVGALLVLCSSFVWAGAMTMIKSLSRTESAVTITLYAGLFMAPITLVPALFVWVTPSPGQLVWLVGIGVAGTLGHLSFAQAFKLADMSAVLPLDFLRLVWASAFGYWLFAEVPTLVSWIGGLTILISTTYIAIREAQIARQGASAKAN